MAEGIKEAFKRRFYTTNNSIRINLFDNDLFLLTTAVVPWYQFDIFPANLKQEVIRLLKSKEKNYSCCETGQSVQAPLVLPNKPKAQLPKIDVPKLFFCLSILHLSWKQRQTLTKVSNNIHLIKRFRQKLFFWLKKIHTFFHILKRVFLRILLIFISSLFFLSFETNKKQ